MNQEDTYSDLYSEIILLCFGMLALFIIFYISIFDLFGSAAYLILGFLGFLGSTKIVATYNSMAGMSDEKFVWELVSQKQKNRFILNLFLLLGIVSYLSA